jgi:hypothetical protein
MLLQDTSAAEPGTPSPPASPTLAPARPQAAPGSLDPSGLCLLFKVLLRSERSGLAVCMELGIMVVADEEANALEVYSIRPNLTGLDLREVVVGGPESPMQVILCRCW